jgi:hypothetical protein
MHENNQATIKKRYCGHLYSPLLRKWTHLDQRDRVFYCMGEGTDTGDYRVTLLWPCSVYRCRSPILNRDTFNGYTMGMNRGHLILSQMHENNQATTKTRYCGHLYSPLLGKWTHLDQRDRVFYCMGRGLILEPL